MAIPSRCEAEGGGGCGESRGSNVRCPTGRRDEPGGSRVDEGSGVVASSWYKDLHAGTNNLSPHCANRNSTIRFRAKSSELSSWRSSR